MRSAAVKRRAPARSSPLLAILRGVALGLALLIAASLGLWVVTVTSDIRLPAIRVGGVSVPRRGELAPFFSEQVKRWMSERIVLHTGQHVFRPTRGELGASLSVHEAVRVADSVGKSWNPLVSLRDWAIAYFTRSGHELPWQGQIADSAALDAYVRAVRAAVDRPPTPGSFGPNDEPIAGLAGEALDAEAAKRAIQRAIARGEAELQVATIVTPPPRSSRRFAEAAPSANVLMMRQETDFRPGNRGRATNIELAARKLHGATMMPGASLSFNRVVGKREPSRGFAPALELINGELAEGIGGGVCQVAGTLHAAAFFAGLQVEEYRPHSRLNQFAYLRPGLDTMVAWPDHVEDVRETKDMRIRNPYPFPIVVKTAIVPRDDGLMTLRVELHGEARPFRVEWSFQELAQTPSTEIRKPEPTLRYGEERLHQDAAPGLVILRRRTIFTPERRIEEETRVAYPPTPRIVLVGRG
jgi:vancomycin resistance protein YoaR